MLNVLGLFFVLGGIACLSDGQFLSCLFGMVLGAVCLLPEIKYYRASASSVWARWETTHASEAQIARMLRAFNDNLTMKKINKKMKTATFVGKDGKSYKTDLRRCTCPDFLERKVPCKHMYKLADELGAIDLEAKFQK